MNHDANNGRTIAAILADARDEFLQFVQTRISLFTSELSEKASLAKRGVPLVALALALLGTAYVLFTLALVGVVLALVPGSPWRWCFAFLAVGVLWAILGVIAAALAKRRFALKELMPNRTIGVLKGDGLWIESEVKNQI